MLIQMCIQAGLLFQMQHVHVCIQKYIIEAVSRYLPSVYSVDCQLGRGIQIDLLSA